MSCVAKRYLTSWYVSQTKSIPDSTICDIKGNTGVSQIISFKFSIYRIVLKYFNKAEKRQIGDNKPKMNKVVKIGKDLRITNEELEQFRLNFSIFTKCDIAPFNYNDISKKKNREQGFFTKSIAKKKFPL